MTRKDAAKQYAHVCAVLALLYRDPHNIPRNEQREAAKALGLESWLPEPVQQALPVKA